MVRRDRRDVANATLVTGVIGMSFMCMCLAFGLDISKNVKIKIDQDAQAQQASSVAVKTVNSRGSLTDSYTHLHSPGTNKLDFTPDKLVSEYMKQSGVSTFTNPNNPSQTITHQDENASYKTGTTCRVRDITLNPDPVTGVSTKVSNAPMPYIVIRLDVTRQISASSKTVTYVSEGGADPVLQSGTYDPKAKYRVVSAEIHDSANNFIMGMFKMPCQDFTSNVSSITFGTNQDLEGLAKATNTVKP